MKKTQAQVRYRRGYRGSKCAFCSMYRKAGVSVFGTCTDVTGKITPYGVCDEYKQLNDPFGGAVISGAHVPHPSVMT